MSETTGELMTCELCYVEGVDPEVKVSLARYKSTTEPFQAIARCRGAYECRARVESQFEDDGIHRRQWPLEDTTPPTFLDQLADVQVVEISEAQAEATFRAASELVTSGDFVVERVPVEFAEDECELHGDRCPGDVPDTISEEDGGIFA